MIAPIEASVFDDDDDGWQDMPVVRENDETSGLDEEDRKKYHYKAPEKKDDEAASGAGNATGNVLDVDYRGNEWRAKVDQNEGEYTRLRLNEEDESDEVHLRTKYLFDEDKAMTPLSQMQATKDLLTEAQRIAYVGLCALAAKEMADKLREVKRKELNECIKDMEIWALRIMGRLYYHMELATEEQKMIESLALHGIQSWDLVPSLMTTHTVANPEYDPAEAKRQEEEHRAEEEERLSELEDSSSDISDLSDASQTTLVPSNEPEVTTPKGNTTQAPVTTRVLEGTATQSIPGVSTHLSAADENITLDIRWTVLCDLFLILIADSVYDARSRVLLETVALKLGLGWVDVVKFERRVTEALEIQEEAEKMAQKDVIETVKKNTRKKRFMMLGLATLGGGLVIGLSAGLLAPVIGAGIGAALATVGATGATGFLAGAGGAAIITTGGVLTGSSIAVQGMARRTQYVRTFDILPLHNNKRVNCILTVPGFMAGIHDDVRLPFSVLDPVVGDVFSVLWEPDMIRETGSALKILTSEVLTQLGQTVLQATVMTALMSALQWPIILTKLGYLIDNPWSNALDRARAAGLILADVLLHRHLGVRPITLIGFSLGARVIFYALLELAKKKAFGIVQDVFLFGTTVTAPIRTWLSVRSVVSGRFVNGYARNDWVLNYLFRATSGGLNTVAGLRPIENVPGLENVDVTDKIAGHMSYRTFMPLILDEVGFPVTADYFDEPVEPDFEGDRIVVREGEEVPKKKKSWFSRKKKPTPQTPVSRPPSSATFTPGKKRTASNATDDDDDLPPREVSELKPHSDSISESATPPRASSTEPATPSNETADVTSSAIPLHAGFDFRAIKEVIGKTDLKSEELKMPTPSPFNAPLVHPPTHRTESAPPPLLESPAVTPRARSSLDLPSLPDEPVAGPSSLSHHDLTSTLSRSLSLSDVKDEDGVTSYNEKTPTGFGLNGPGSIPTLSFGSSDGGISSWPAESPSTYSNSPVINFQDRLSYNSLGSGFGNGFGPNRSETFRSVSSPLPSLNPFAPPDSASLSFGGSDGSITFSPSLSSSVERDPWDAGRQYSNSKKSASTLNLNPWQS